MARQVCFGSTKYLMTIPTLNHNRDYIYLLVDEVTDGILHATDDLSAASAMAVFSLRIKIIPLETHKSFLRKDLLDVDYKDPDVHLIWRQAPGLRKHLPMPPADITNEYLAFKQEVKTRTLYHELLLIRVLEASVTNFVETPLLEKFSSTIVDDLLRSNPESGYFTPGIRAYASASEVDDATAFRELQLHIDNLKTVRMYLLGTYIKYRNLLNKADASRESQMRVIETMLNIIHKKQS